MTMLVSRLTSSQDILSDKLNNKGLVLVLCGIICRFIMIGLEDFLLDALAEEERKGEKKEKGPRDLGSAPDQIQLFSEDKF